MTRDELYDPAEPPECCELCEYYESSKVGYVCGILMAEYSEEELKAMSKGEFMKRFCKDPEDSCDDFSRWEG